MIGHSRVLDPALRTPDKTRLMARQLLTKATQRLRRKGSYAGSLSLGVSDTNQNKWKNSIRLPAPAQDPFTFLQHLDILWDSMMSHYKMRGIHSVKFKKVSTTLTELKERPNITGDLFDTTEQESAETIQKRESLTLALDKLQNKYQKETVTLGVPPKTLSGHVGTKIAFSRVPDQEEFWE